MTANISPQIIQQLSEGLARLIVPLIAATANSGGIAPPVEDDGPKLRTLDPVKALAESLGVSVFTLNRMKQKDGDFPAIIYVGRTPCVEREAWNRYVDILAKRGRPLDAEEGNDALDTRSTAEAVKVAARRVTARKRELKPRKRA